MRALRRALPAGLAAVAAELRSGRVLVMDVQIQDDRARTAATIVLAQPAAPLVLIGRPELERIERQLAEIVGLVC